MVREINLDRAGEFDIKYPIGVKETITFTYNEETTITDDFEVLISLKNSREVFKRITEADTELSKATNVLTWIVEFAQGEIQERIYQYEIRNITQDWIEFKGQFIPTKTIKTT